MSDKTNNLATPVAIVIAGIFIAAAVLYSNGAFSGNGFNTNTKQKNTNGESLVASTYQKYVDIAGDIKVDEFEACMDAQDKSEIEKDLADAQLVGALGTPAFFIGLSNDSGTIRAIPIKGAYPMSSFENIIDGLIEGNDQKILDGLNLNPDGPIIADPEEVYIEVSVDDDPVKGDQNAQITIIEFSDYECPFCQRHFQQVLPQLESKYINNGTVKYVFRDLPLAFHDPIATEAAIAANCVRDQLGDEGYFAFHDEYYTATKTNGAGL